MVRSYLCMDDDIVGNHHSFITKFYPVLPLQKRKTSLSSNLHVVNVYFFWLSASSSSFWSHHHFLIFFVIVLLFKVVFLLRIIFIFEFIYIWGHLYFWGYLHFTVIFIFEGIFILSCIHCCGFFSFVFEVFFILDAILRSRSSKYFDWHSFWNTHPLPPEIIGM